MKLKQNIYMKLAFIFFAAAGISGQCMSNSIEGHVTGLVGEKPQEELGLGKINVTFYDALNAEVLEFTETVSLLEYLGDYSSGEIAIGNYRVRFSDDEKGAYFPRFYKNPNESSEGNNNDFCSSSIVPVSSNKISVANQILDTSTGIPILPASKFNFGGRVSDSEGALLPGLKVSILNGINGPLISDTVTFEPTAGFDANYVVKLLSAPISIRIRVQDPKGHYYPQFYSSEVPVSRSDDFCKSTKITEGKQGSIDFLMELIPASPQGIIDQVVNLALPSGMTTYITTPLIRVVDTLTDENIDNDVAACGHLNAFISRLSRKVKGGSPIIPLEQADELKGLAEDLKAEQNCPM